jgi:hypothetical protein
MSNSLPMFKNGASWDESSRSPGIAWCELACNPGTDDVCLKAPSDTGGASDMAHLMQQYF